MTRSNRGWIIVVQPRKRTRHGWLTFTRAEARAWAKVIKEIQHTMPIGLRARPVFVPRRSK